MLEPVYETAEYMPELEDKVDERRLRPEDQERRRKQREKALAREREVAAIRKRRDEARKKEEEERFEKACRDETAMYNRSKFGVTKFA